MKQWAAHPDYFRYRDHTKLESADCLFWDTLGNNKVWVALSWRYCSPVKLTRQLILCSTCAFPSRSNRQNVSTSDIRSFSHPTWAVFGASPAPVPASRISTGQNAGGLSILGLFGAFRVKPNTTLVATVEGSAERSQHDFLVKPTTAGAMKILAATSRA